MKIWGALGLWAALIIAPCAAQTAEPLAATTIQPAAAQTASPAPGAIRIPAGAELTMEITQPLSSRTSQIGDLFTMRLSEPIIVDSRVVVPAGAIGGGEVIDSKHSSLGGEEGRLILAGRFLEIGGQRVQIRRLRIGQADGNRSGLALGLSTIPVAGVGAIFVHGGEVEIPAGAQASALLANNFDLVPPAPQGQATN